MNDVKTLLYNAIAFQDNWDIDEENIAYVENYNTKLSEILDDFIANNDIRNINELLFICHNAEEVGELNAVMSGVVNAQNIIAKDYWPLEKESENRIVFETEYDGFNDSIVFKYYGDMILASVTNMCNCMIVVNTPDMCAYVDELEDPDW